MPKFLDPAGIPTAYAKSYRADAAFLGIWQTWTWAQALEEARALAANEDVREFYFWIASGAAGASGT